MQTSSRNSPSNTSIRQMGRALWYFMICLLAFIVGIGLYLLNNDNVNSSNTQNSLELQHATSFHNNPSAFPTFNLVDHHGKKYSNDKFKDVWSFVFFGFTNCPDICPLTLNIIDQVINELNKTQELNAQAILISVDPKRDTTKQLHEYVRYFNDFTIGLTGDRDEIKQLTQKLGVVYTTPAQETSEDYVVDHSAHIFLVSPDGNLLALLSTPHEVETIVNDFNALNTYFKKQIF